jgi:ABC-type multidrug transport system ATPase subunit
MKLEFDGIEFRYNEHPLLTGVYGKCEVGRVTGLLGRNGSGKSTLLRIVFGSLKADVKSVRVNDTYIPSPAFSSNVISYLPQESFIPSFLSLKQILNIYKINVEQITTDFPEVGDELCKRKNQISGGIVRLFENLLILYSPSPFCFLDEPFSGLSPVMIERLAACIQRKKESKGILITDHLHKHVRKVSNDLYILTNGKTYAVKNEEDLIRRGYLAGIDY